VVKYYNQLLPGWYLLFFIFFTAPGASAQINVKPAQDNFTYFTPGKNYTDAEKLTELTPAAFRNHPDYGKCFTDSTNWYEQIDKRTLKTRRYVSDEGQVIVQYSYDNLNYVDNKGWLCAIDTKLKPAENGWAVKQQENPAYLYTDASTSLSIGNGQLIIFNKNVQFNSAAINTKAKTAGDNGMMIKDVAANTDKIIRFKRNTVETDYLINKPIKLSGDLIISEDIILPAGYIISQDDAGDGNEAGSLAVIGPDGKVKAVLKVPVCYDKGRSEIIGSYHIQKQVGGYRLEIDVSSSWINSPSRIYPVTIDPVITGTTTQWSGGKIASCLYPNFGSGSMDVEIPADITITGFYIQSSYYANPIESEPLDDGLVYFGTKCGSTGLISISPPQGNLSGTGVLPLTDFHSSLSCCIYPSCSPQSINLTMNLSRLAGGSACDSQYIYYDPANTGGSPFEAYIVGNTVQLNNSQWSVSPTTLCGNDCNLTLTATINYGVPPYTISHAWADSSETVGKYDTSICSSTGSVSITLTIPNCPISSCTTTLLSVPAPTITDACGTVVSGLTFKFINVKPVPKVTAMPDSQDVCSGDPFDVSLTSCVGGTTFTWTGSDGSSGSGSPIVDSVPNTSDTAQTVTYSITPSAGGCTGNPVTIPVKVEPIPTSAFTVKPSEICVNGKLVVSYTGPAFAGAVYNWNFGGATLLSGSATGPGPDTISFDSSGTYAISLYVTANGGCTSKITTDSVRIKPNPVIVVTPTPATICIGTPAALSASGANSYTWSPSTGLSSTTGSSVSANDTSTTIYFVTGKDTNGCVTTVMDTVNVNPKPKIIANPSPASYCPGGSSTLTVSGGKTYTWSPSTGLSVTTGDTVTANPTTTTTYIVTGTDSNGCSDTAKVIVTVNLKPIITVSPSSPSYCPGGSSTLIASGGKTYTWSPSTGLSATTGDTVTANPTITTTYTIMGTTLLGCSDSNTVIITVNPNPIIMVTPTPDTICSGRSAILSASGASTYIWSPAASLSSSSGSSVNATPLIGTTYTVIGVSSGGCKDTVNAIISVNPKPNIIAAPPTIKICFTDSVNLTVKGGNTYSWSPSSGLSMTSGDSIIAIPLNTTRYLVTGTDTNGCSDTASVLVTVIKPIITFTPPNPSVCLGNNATIIASGVSTYTWTPAGGLSSSGDTAFITDPRITSTYTVNGIDSNGCHAAATTITLKVDSNPKGKVTPDSTTICEGVGTTLSTSGASTYFWSPAAGLSSSTGSSVVATPLLATTYTVIGVDTNGCKDTVNVSVSVNPKPIIIAAPSTISICHTDSVDLTASGGKTYTWSPSSGLNTTSGDSIIAIPVNTTRYLVTGTDTNGCSDTSSALITIVPGPTLTINPVDTELCIGSNVTLVVSGALTYSWSPSPGLSCTTCSNPIVSTTVTSTYIVKSTNTFCPGFDTITVKIDTIPTLSVSGDTLLCQLQPVQLNAATSGVISWSPSTGLNCTTCDNPVANPNSTTTYTALAKNGACSVSDSVTILINIFIFSVGPNQHIIYTGTAQLSANGAVHYIWMPSNTLSNDTINDPVANPTITTTYYVTGTDSLGCSSIDTIIVFVGSPCQLIQIPSAFSPDGGGKNEYFHVLSHGDVSLSYFKVFNRWGQTVYQTNDINDRGWDGTFNGKPQAIGTYVYEAEVNCEGTTMYLHGSVALIR
jgi:gliding motility-associated-like protein